MAVIERSIMGEYFRGSYTIVLPMKLLPFGEYAMRDQMPDVPATI